MSVLLKDLRSRITKDFGPDAVLAQPLPGRDIYSYTAPDQLIVEGSANDAEMYIDFVVVTNEDDREGDTINPMGCVDFIGEYERNAAWLAEHDAKEQIAVCRAALGGPLTLRIEESKIIARPYYNRLSLRGSRLSEEFYLLAKAGLFIGASPGFLPIEAKKRGYSKNDGFNYQRWRLTELSQTSQPVNQSALRMSLSRGIVKSLGLKSRLESLLIKANPVVRGGFAGEVGALRPQIMKPRTASVEFDKDVFKTAKSCVAWLDSHGQDSSSYVDLPTSFVFAQIPGVKASAGKKSLGKGVTALLTKAFGKKDDDEEDKDKPKDEEKKPGEEKAEIDDDKIEKADDEKPEDDVEDDDAEIDEDGDEGEESEEVAEDETEYDPEQLKKESSNLLDMIAHFEVALDHAPRMAKESVKAPELFEELKTTAEAFVAKLRDAHKTMFSEQMMDDAIDERKNGAVAKEDEPAPASDGEIAKAFKSMREQLAAA